MRNLIVFVFFVGFFQNGFSQGARASADRNKILIGEQIKLHLEAEFPSAQVKWPEIDSIPHFEVLERSDVDRKESGNAVTMSQTLTLTSWDSGQIFIPPLQLGVYTTAPIRIDVAYSPSPFDTTQPYHDVHDILQVKKPNDSPWKWYLIGLLVLVILFLLFFPKGKPKPKPEFVSDANAYKKALQQLEALKSNSDADRKQLYTGLVQILREYLYRRRNIYSYSKTSDDLAIQMEKLNLEREQYQQALQSLRLSDSVKYARYEPSRSETEEAIDTIRQTIIAIENLPHVV
jgi:hypothetical protein